MKLSSPIMNLSIDRSLSSSIANSYDGASLKSYDSRIIFCIADSISSLSMSIFSVYEVCCVVFKHPVFNPLGFIRPELLYSFNGFHHKLTLQVNLLVVVAKDRVECVFYATCIVVEASVSVLGIVVLHVLQAFLQGS